MNFNVNFNQALLQKLQNFSSNDKVEISLKDPSTDESLGCVTIQMEPPNKQRKECSELDKGSVILPYGDADQISLNFPSSDDWKWTEKNNLNQKTKKNLSGGRELSTVDVELCFDKEQLRHLTEEEKEQAFQYLIYPSNLDPVPKIASDGLPVDKDVSREHDDQKQKFQDTTTYTSYPEEQFASKKPKRETTDPLMNDKLLNMRTTRSGRKSRRPPNWKGTWPIKRYSERRQPKRSQYVMKPPPIYNEQDSDPCEDIVKQFPVEKKTTRRRGDMWQNEQQAGNRWLKCSSCSFRTQNRGALNRHFMCKHAVYKAMVSCDLCPFVTSLRCGLQTHYINKHGLSKDSASMFLQQKMSTGKQRDHRAPRLERLKSIKRVFKKADHPHVPSVRYRWQEEQHLQEQELQHQQKQQLQQPLQQQHQQQQNQQQQHQQQQHQQQQHQQYPHQQQRQQHQLQETHQYSQHQQKEELMNVDFASQQEMTMMSCGVPIENERVLDATAL
ncbi:uncharacterized protein LOC142354068 isoform X2 [Convolutriloba macropyga]|uniref:uncharacterized protein LOC142354068 isoform X2 n=1 Tax=Convolutriloba macropyga TaxID=536237 RepID=UPI003F5270A4